MRSQLRIPHLPSVIIAAILAVLVLLMPTLASAESASPAPSHTYTAADVFQSIVMVHTSWEGYVTVTDSNNAVHSGWASMATMCTGWIVSRSGDIVTAGHCVDPESAKEGLSNNFIQRSGFAAQDKGGQLPPASVTNVTTSLRVSQSGISDSSLSNPVRVSLIDYQETSSGDVALLRLPYASSTLSALPIAAARPSIGETTDVLGFPGVMTSALDSSKLTPIASRGFVTSHEAINGVAVTGVSAPIAPGMSGGPALNSRGEVYGVASFLLSADYGVTFGFVTATEGLRSFLLRNNVQTTTIEATASPKSQSSNEPDTGKTALWVLLSILCGLLIAAIAVIRYQQLHVNSLRSQLSVAAPPNPSGSVQVKTSASAPSDNHDHDQDPDL